MMMHRALFALTCAVGSVESFLVRENAAVVPRPRVARVRPLRGAAIVANDDDDDGLYDGSTITGGTSPKALRLRKAVQAVWNDPADTSPIILHGPRGSGKGELAEDIVYRLPSWQTREVHRLSLDDGLEYVDTVLGNADHPGLLDDLSSRANATVIIKGFQSKSAGSKDQYDRRGELIRALSGLVVGDRTYFSVHENATRAFLPRVVGCTQRDPSFFRELSGEGDGDGADRPPLDAIFIQVPSLESRTRDIESISRRKIRIFARALGMTNVTLSGEATQRLLDHTWGSDADAELDSELYSGLKLLASERKWNPFASGSRLEPRHLLVNADNERIRKRLLYDVPFLRNVIMSPWVFGKTLTYIVAPVFAAYVAVLFLGPQTRDHSAALTVFWAGWWPGIMLVFPFLGRIWCTVCPFMAWGNIAQEVAQLLDVQLRKWPSEVKNWGPAFAFGLFYAILMWEELWDLPQNASLSAWLLLLITFGSVVGSLFYEKRIWCRYMCPIGAMNKMFATAAMTEIRTFKANCDGCTDPTCAKGGSATLDPNDNYAIKGCTMGLKNNQLRDMGDCVMCMSCVKNCDRESPEFNLRPLGQDYGLPWFLPMQFQKPESLAISQVETNFWLGGIITILQGSVALHYLPKLLDPLSIDVSIATAKPALDVPFAMHATISAMVLAFPGTLSLAADKASVPLESLVNVWKRRFTSHPAENYAIIQLYEAMIKENNDVTEIMKEWDVDGDGIVSEWEMIEAFKRLDIPDYEHQLLINALRYALKDTHRIDGDPTVSEMMDSIQELYFDIQEAKQSSTLTYRDIAAENELETKLTFVEMFNRLDKDGTGYITREQFGKMSELGYYKVPLTAQESNDLFDSADILRSGKLNLFEFMSVMRKTVKVGIQEIGYGYLPLAWGSLLSYWIGLGMKELGLSLVRLPDTFGIPFPDSWKSNIPQFVGSMGSIHTIQCVVMLTSLACSVSLTQKLCDDNRIGSVRFGTHAVVQTLGTAITLCLMLSPELGISSYR